MGHSTLAADVFLRILRDNGIHALADIRTIPKSRHNPQFSGEALAASLAAAEIEYRWFQSLGGLRHPRKVVTGETAVNGAWKNLSFRGYADYMQTEEFARGIDDLLAYAPPASTVILCAEAVPWRCHRSLVGDALLARGVEVEDIFFGRNGESQRRPHRLTSFARIEGTRVWYPAPAA